MSGSGMGSVADTHPHARTPLTQRDSPFQPIGKEKGPEHGYMQKSKAKSTQLKDENDDDDLLIVDSSTLSLSSIQVCYMLEHIYILTYHYDLLLRIHT